jgi:signal transduction histidine kinase
LIDAIDYWHWWHFRHVEDIRAGLDTVPAVFVLWSKNEGVRQLNNEYLASFSEEWGTQFSELFDISEQIQQFRDSPRQEIVYDVSFPMNDGKSKVDYIFFFRKYDRGNKIIAVGLDISDQKVVERELKNAYSQQKTIQIILNRIRTSLEIEETLQLACEEVRKELSCSRVVIYQFNSSYSEGWVCSESIDDKIGSIRGRDLEDPCFNKVAKEYIRKGFAVCSDVRNTQSCYKEMLLGLNAKSSLTVPIMEEDKLWGLMACHQQEPFYWDERAIVLVREVCRQLQIAVQQHKLYEQLRLREQQLKVDLQREQLLLEDGLVGVLRLKWNKSQDFTIGYVQNSEQFFRSSSSAMSGKNFLDFIHPQDRDTFLAVCEAIVSGTTGNDDIFYRVVDANRQIKWVYNFVRVARAHEAEIEIDGYIVDVTSYRQAEERAKLLVSSLPVFIFAIDKENRFALCEGRNIRGIPSQIVGQNVIEVYANLNCFEVGEAIEAARAGDPLKKTFNLNGQFYRHYFTRSENEESVLGVAFDVTDLTIAQLALEKASQEMEAFLHFTSHDLQAPLRTVSNYHKLFLRHLQKQYSLTPEADPVLSSHTEKIQASLERERRLIEDLLAFSRINRVESDIELLDLNEILNSVKAVLADRITENRATIFCRQTLPTLWGDRTQIESVFQNLLSNAIKFQRPDLDPEIRIECEERLLDGERAWYFRWIDNGIGIAPLDGSKTFEEAAEAIFSPFKKMHSSSYSGTGIGLAVVKAVIEKHRGKVWASENPSGGTIFHLHLPEGKGREV